MTLGAIVLVALVLLFPRLDDRYLWEDEAETALLARNVLRFGLPVGWDGRDLVSQECGADLDANGLWRQTPWLPMYLAAASFGVFGVNAFAARLPFVLLAVATLPSLWLLGRRVFDDRRVATLATLTLTLSVPFLVHARQSRYYSLVTFAVVWTLVAFFGVLRAWLPTGGTPARRLPGALRAGGVATAGLVIALSVLFHANYLLFAVTVAGLGVALGALRPDRAACFRLALAGGAVIAVNAPWVLVFDAGGKTALARELLSPAAFAQRLLTYLRAIELHLFPVLVLVPALALALVRRRRRGEAAPSGLDVAGALALFAIGYVAALSLTPLTFLRYLVGLFPVFALLVGYIVVTLARTQVVLAALVLVFVVGVDRADLVRLAPGSPLLKYLEEITHDFDGPIEAAAKFLAREARPGERVYVTYGALGLRFHTGLPERGNALEVRGGTGCQSLEGWGPPEWMVVRWFFRLNPVAAEGLRDAARVRQWVNRHIVSGEYRRIELPAIDTVHEALPEPDLHLYRMPGDGRRVVVWERVGREKLSRSP